MIFWLLKLLTGNFAFYNNVWPNAPYLNPPDIKHGDCAKLDYCITSYEDRYLPLVIRHLDNRAQQISEPRVERAINILLMRDPFNLFASRLRSSAVSSEKTLFSTGLSPTQLYLHYSREYSGKTCYLGSEAVRISYNLWNDSERYRATLCSALNLEYRAVSVDEIPDYGDGSSFQARSSVKSARELHTSSRWRYYTNDKRYECFFRNKELVSFGIENFQLPVKLQQWVSSSLIPNTSLARNALDNLKILVFANFFMYLRRLRDRFRPIQAFD